MFNKIFDTITSQILLNRLQRLQSELKNVIAYTEVDYQAAVYSKVNMILNRGNRMLPNKHIIAESPAVIGDIEQIFTNLNSDGQDIAAELLNVEGQIAQLYNLSANVQNALRQTIRGLVFVSNRNQFNESFVDASQLQSGYTANIDFRAGLSTAPLLTDTVVTPSIIQIGTDNIESGDNSAFDPTQLLNKSGKVNNKVIWYGDQLELQIVFDKLTPVNRLIIQQFDYSGLEITSLSSTADGISFDGIDIELYPFELLLNGQSNKFTGDGVIDFNPRNVKTLRMVLRNTSGANTIALRGLEFHQRVYASSGSFQTMPIYFPSSGSVKFDTKQKVYPQLTSVINQISYDGVHFTVIQPGDIIKLDSSPFWYQARLDRLEAAFSGVASPLNTGTGDPEASPDYTVTNIATINLNADVLQRSIALSDVSGPVVLSETPVPGTLIIYFGSVLQSTSAYSFINNAITFTTLPQSNVTIRYQLSSLGSTNIAALKKYFSPYLLEATFTKA